MLKIKSIFYTIISIIYIAPCSATTPTTINKKVEVFNQWLAQTHPEASPLTLKFHWQNNACKSEYLDLLKKQKSHPVADSLCSHTIHDISFHYSSLFLPDEYLEFIQRKAETVLLFMKYLGQEVGKNPKTYKGAKFWLHDALVFEVGSIDSILSFANGNLTVDDYTKDENIDETARRFSGIWTAPNYDQNDPSQLSLGLSHIELLENSVEYFLDYFVQQKKYYPKSIIKKIIKPNNVTDRLIAGHQRIKYGSFKYILRSVFHKLHQKHPQLDKIFLKTKEDAERLFDLRIQHRQNLLKLSKEFLQSTKL